jgi:DNA processing protein
MARDELALWLRLAFAPGIGPASARRLLAAFGLPHDIFRQPLAALQGLLPPDLAQAVLDEPAGLADLVEATWQWLDGGQARHHRILTLADAGYPPGLLNTEDPPLLLYVMGRPLDAWPRAIAMVGSRNATPQGLENARHFARDFAQCGLAVVSGLALGIDGAAHEGALEGAAPGQLATIAVVGTGLDRVYPKRHLDLAHRICEHGLIVSEFPLGTPPLQQNFPRRNRLIAALSEGTLVVEAALQSGSLITARLALEQGKEVFAIPGSIHATTSRGCHLLLKQGAKLVETAQDVLDELRPGIAPVSIADTPDEQGAAGRSDGDGALLATLGFDPCGLDALVARTGLAPSLLQAALLELELAGQVARLPGGLFQRVAAG